MTRSHQRRFSHSGKVTSSVSARVFFKCDIHGGTKGLIKNRHIEFVVMKKTAVDLVAGNQGPPGFELLISAKALVSAYEFLQRWRMTEVTAPEPRVPWALITVGASTTECVEVAACGGLFLDYG